MSTTLKDGLSTVTNDQVKNVLMFVADSLRYDYLPEKIANKGVTAKAIAPSTFTASSLPSIFTGRYPASHGVWMFEDILPEIPELLSLNSHDIGFDAEGVWIDLPPEEKPPLQIHRIREERKLEHMSEPFVHIIHDMGPHAPYGFENGVFESTKEYFKKYERRGKQLRTLYEKNSETSAERFLEFYRKLQRSDQLEETLFVFTSDHGESLGETRNGGRFGHGHPLSPETVHVPIVFCGAGLPENVSYQHLLSSTDIVPTILSAIGHTKRQRYDGVDIWSSAPRKNRLLRSEIWQHLSIPIIDKDITVYSASSAWNQTGGHVFHQKSQFERVSSIMYDNLIRGYSPAWKTNLTLAKAMQMVKIAGGKYFQYGNPDFTIEQARSVIPDELSDRDQHTMEVLNKEQREQLKDMGYL